METDEIFSVLRYLYGGNVPPDQQGMGYNDVWVLSIPSFTWTNVSTKGSEEKGNGS